MEFINRIERSMEYLAEQIVSRPDGELYLPLLEKLKAEHDRLIKAGTILDFARSLAAAKQDRRGRRAASRKETPIKRVA